MKKTQTMIPVVLIVLNIMGAAGLAISEHDSENISTLFMENNDNGDITWTKHMIEEDISHASGIHACDIDNDGDTDVVACGAHDNEVAFWRNDGGDPIEWTKYSIDDEFAYPMDVFTCDIDDDGDIDVLGAAWTESEIALWKNAGGNPIKWVKQTIKSNYPGAHEVYACDFDEDGDYDVFGASAGLNRIDWWRNDGGIPIQWTEQTIGQQFGGARSVFSRDIDDDGEKDVVGAALTDNTISWWCNEGGDPIAWTEYEITNEFEGAHHVSADDVDGDGDIDVLGAAYFQNEFAWWQNEGGEPITWKKQVIDSSSFGAMRVCVDDIDNDGDKDIIGSSSKGNSISWWSNDGEEPIYWTKHTIDNQCPKAWPIYLVDMDDDGDMDLVGGSESSGGIMWYENSLYPIGSDLECEGSLRWTNVKPESTITGSFSVSNAGKPGSFLDWEVNEYPAWGTWSFQPDDGEDLRPEDGEVEVVVTVKVPHGSNEEFTGEIKIINVDDRSDYSIIDVTLITPKDYATIFLRCASSLFNIFEKHPNIFLLLELIFVLESK